MRLHCRSTRLAAPNGQHCESLSCRELPHGARAQLEAVRSLHVARATPSTIPNRSIHGKIVASRVLDLSCGATIGGNLWSNDCSEDPTISQQKVSTADPKLNPASKFSER